ncbi:MAG: hypothetical protein BGO69_18265 [Bacteroidetes bacterium 46-16]|nr:MAG: hypothetical protein BGO69_18265 [Bacteroidetes bacterium 46-16]
MTRYFLYGCIWSLCAIPALHAQGLHFMPQPEPPNKARTSDRPPLRILPQNTARIHTTGILRPDLYTRHLGFFCRQELKMEKQTKLPLRIRLGSMEYCDWLEGKSSAPGYQR